VRDHAARQLIPGAKVQVIFERRRPPLEATPASRALAEHAQGIYKTLGRELGADDKVGGGGTDAAFAGLRTKAPVVERFGLQGFGAHSLDAEYVLIDSIEPRLYLSAQMIIDISRGKAGAAAP
jgi:glutamate carboxypeptidase